MSPTKKIVKLIKNNCFLTRHTSSTDIHPFLNTRQNIKSHVQQNKANIVKFENGNSFLFFIFCSIGKCFGCVLVNCMTIIVFCLQYSCSVCLFRFKKENTRSWNLFKANKKDTGMTSLTSLCVFIVNYEQILLILLVFHYWIWTSKCKLGTTTIIFDKISFMF